LRGKHEVKQDIAYLCTVHVRKDVEERAAPDCPICLSKIFKNATTTETPCGHRYHRHCLDRWLRRGSTTCPTCRGQIQNPYVVVDASTSQQQQQQQQPQRPPTPPTPPTDDDEDGGPPHVAVALDLRQLLDMIVQLTPHYDEHQFYANALFQQVTHPLMTQYLPPDREIRDIIAEVASRSPSSNVFIRFLEDMNII